MVTIEWNETARLGTELEVVADFDLTPLLKILRPRVGILRNSVDSGRHTLWLELDPTETDLDDAVRRYAAMIEALPEGARRLWDTSLDRCLNTGIQSGETPHAYILELSPESMALEVRLSIRQKFTVYAVRSTKPRSKTSSK